MLLKKCPKLLLEECQKCADFSTNIRNIPCSKVDGTSEVDKLKAANLTFNYVRRLYTQIYFVQNEGALFKYLTYMICSKLCNFEGIYTGM